MIAEQYEEASEHQVVLRQIRELEIKVKDRVDDETWLLIMKWEELWAYLLVQQESNGTEIW